MGRAVSAKDTCNVCGGFGISTEEVCNRCKGRGTVLVERRLVTKLPQGAKVQAQVQKYMDKVLSCIG